MSKKRIRSRTKINVFCLGCKKQFSAFKHKVKSGGGKYCTLQCYSISSREDLTGKIFNRLTVISFSHMVKDSHGTKSIWNTICECGTKKAIVAPSLKSGGSKSCGCLLIERVRKSFGESCSNQHFYRYKKSAETRNLIFSLDFETFKSLILDDCHYCGAIPSIGYINKNTHGYIPTNGIDRLDNDVGYIKENVVTCCKICNFMKMKLSKESFINQVKKINLFQENSSKPVISYEDGILSSLAWG